MQKGVAKKKRIRPPRGAGLRSRAGCVPCRLRHRKCDEVRPFCSNCTKLGRDCEWQDSEAVADGPVSAFSRTGRSEETIGLPSFSSGFGNVARSDTLSVGSHTNASNLPFEEANTLQHPPGPSSSDSIAIAGSSRATGSPISTLLMHDATPSAASSAWWSNLWNDPAEHDVSNLVDTFAVIDSSIKAAFPQIQWHAFGLTGPPDNQEARKIQSHQFDMGRWQDDSSPAAVPMTPEDTRYLRNYVYRCSRWLDVFDPEQTFGTHVAKLALHDEGLMNAVLALSARHLYREQRTQIVSTITELDDPSVQFYYKALCYVQQAMHYATYAQSEELLATSLIASTYEMLDESMEGWTHHLKGVFWIQRLQSVNSLSVGVRRAVWWAWMRQEQWAALQEERKSISYHVPPEPISNQTQDDLVNYITVILRFAINFAAKEDRELVMDVELLATRMRTAEKIVGQLTSWQRCLHVPFQALFQPQEGLASNVSSNVRGVFRPIWVHPPKFAVALQHFHLARLLVHLHKPVLNGIGSDSEARNILDETVSMICGLAMAIEDEGCQVVSSQCLYGAGLYEHAIGRQEAILELMDRCERLSGWPTDQLKTNLQRRWNKT